MNAPANVLAFRGAPSLFDSIRRAALAQLTTEQKLDLIDALTEGDDLAEFVEADKIACQVALIRSDINAPPAETLDPYGVEQFSRAAVYGWPL